MGVKDTAPVDEIKKAYKKLARQYHPDRFPDDEVKRAEAEEIMAKITEAHQTLTDEEKRNEYDFMKKLQAGMSSGGQRPPQMSDEERSRERKAKAEQFYKQANDALSGGDKRKAAQILEDAIKNDEKAEYYLKLAEIYFDLKLVTRARENIVKALEKDERNHAAKNLKKKIDAASPPPAAASAGKPAAGGKKDEKKGGGMFGWLFGK